MSGVKKVIQISYYNIRGGALFYAIFLMLLLSVLSMLLLSYYELSFKEDFIFYKKKELDENVSSAIVKVSCQPEIVPVGVEKEIDLFGGGNSLVKVISERWGVLRKITAQASWKNLSGSQTYLLAEKEKKRSALWVPNRNNYISLVGNSYINGDCYMSELGLRKGNAEGRYFEGPYLHNGNLYKSTGTLPDLDHELVEYCFKYLENQTSLKDSTITYQDFKKNRELYHSFKSKTLLVRNAQSKFVLDKGNYQGNIMFFASDTIEVWPSIKLDDVLLLAKTIIFKSGFKGQVQAIAGRKLLIESDCKFNYPSFLTCFSKSPEAYVKIGERNWINGGVICFSSQSKESKTKLDLGSGSKIYGKVYVNGDLVFNKNSVYGSIYCNRFVYSTSRAFYENFIIDAGINEEELPNEYASFCVGNELFKLKEVSLCQ
jgi:hypothetical protein